MALRPVLLSLLALLLVVPGAGVSSAQSAWPPEEAPTAWRGTANGHDLISLMGARSFRRRGSVHQFGDFVREVLVDGDQIWIRSLDGSNEWTGTLAQNVVFDDAGLDALADHLADRLADAGVDLPFDPAGPPVSIRSAHMRVALMRGGSTFVVSGRVSFSVLDEESGLKRYGRYLFRAYGATEEYVPEPPPVRVLLLGDGGSEVQIEGALLGAGYAVTTIARYVDWDGMTPDVADFDVVVYLNGREYGFPLAPAADAALAGFVANGGGLVRTEWALWAGPVNPLTDPLLPLIYGGGFRYGFSFPTDWTVMLPDHPLAADVAPSWRDLGDYSLALPGVFSTVVVETQDGYPLVTFATTAGGTVVHINHALTYSGTSLDANVLQLFVNAASFAGGR